MMRNGVCAAYITSLNLTQQSKPNRISRGGSVLDDRRGGSGPVRVIVGGCSVRRWQAWATGLFHAVAGCCCGLDFSKTCRCTRRGWPGVKSREYSFHQHGCCTTPRSTYCISKKLWPILYRNLLYKMGHYFLDIQYVTHFIHKLTVWPS